MTISIFDGNNGDAYWWVLCTENHFKMNGTPEKTQVTEAVMALQGRALHWWLWWSHRHPKSSWDTFTTAFIWRFKPEYREVLPIYDEEEEPEPEYPDVMLLTEEGEVEQTEDDSLEMHLGAATAKDIDPYDDSVSNVDSESDSFQAVVGDTTFHSSNLWCPPPTTTMKPTRRSSVASNKLVSSVDGLQLIGEIDSLPEQSNAPQLWDTKPYDPGPSIPTTRPKLPSGAALVPSVFFFAHSPFDVGDSFSLYTHLPDSTLFISIFQKPEPLQLTRSCHPTTNSIHRRPWSLPKRVPRGKTHDSVLFKIYYSLLRDCSWRMAWNEGVTIQAHQWKSGVDPASHFCVSLLNFYATYGFPNSAHLVFVEMPELGAVSCTALIPSFMARGNGWDGTQVQADATQIDFFSVKEVLWCMLRIQQGHNRETTNIFYLLRLPETVSQNYVNSFLMSSCLPQDFVHYLLLHAYNSEIVGKDSVAEQILKGMLINLSTCLETIFPICSVSYSPVTNIWEILLVWKLLASSFYLAYGEIPCTHHTESFLSMEEFKNEVRLLSSVKHKNLIGLVDCCAEAKLDGTKILVYAYVSDGSLLEIYSKLYFDASVQAIKVLAQGYSTIEVIELRLQATNILSIATHLMVLQVWLPFMCVTKPLTASIVVICENVVVHKIIGALFLLLESTFVSIILALPSRDHVKVLTKWSEVAKRSLSLLEDEHVITKSVILSADPSADNTTSLRGWKSLAFFTVESIGTLAAMCTTLYFLWIEARRILKATIDNSAASMIIFPVSTTSKQHSSNSLKDGSSSRFVLKTEGLLRAFKAKLMQWNVGGHLVMFTAAMSSQFKQWDPGKLFKGATSTTLRTRLFLMGYGMIRSWKRPKELPNPPRLGLVISYDSACF